MRVTPGILGIAFMMAVVPVDGQIVTDGTVGPVAPLTGPDYLIDPSLGTQQGGSLFHSFSEFNVLLGESATFGTLSPIEHIIARVTGGGLSIIDGRVAIEGDGAPSLWLINPAGLIFGPGADLDVPGSFHASTADYLVLGDSGLYSVRDPNLSVLVAAAPSAFGFLGDNSGRIEFNRARIEVTEGSTVSITATGIGLTDSVIYAPSGQIVVAAVDDIGEAGIADNGLDLGGFQAFGPITLTHPGGETIINGGQRGANLDVSSSPLTGEAAGSVFIRGGEIIIDDATIRSVNLSDQDAGSIDLLASDRLSLTGEASIFSASRGDGVGAEIYLQGGDIEVRDSAFILTRNEAAGRAGLITVSGDSLALSGGGAIRSETGLDAVGAGADISVDAANISLGDSATLAALTFSAADAGDVSLQADRVLIEDDAIVQASTRGRGDAGDIRIHSSSLELADAGTIEVSTGLLGSDAEFGDGGTIAISTETLILDGVDTLISSETLASGQGGSIAINATSVLLDNGARLSVSASGTGDAGRIDISSADLTLAGAAQIESATAEQGNGGSLALNAEQIALFEGAMLQTRSDGTGLAGNISLSAANLSLLDSGIFTNADVADGGNIAIRLSDLLVIRNGSIETSVSDGTGSGGNITIERPEVIALQNSAIRANAFGGNGGNILIVTGGLVNDTSSVIEASSALGIAGEINVQTPENDVEGAISAPQADFLDIQKLLASPCERITTAQSRFQVNTNRSVPLAPWEMPWLNDMKPSSITPGTVALARIACALDSEIR